MMNWEGIELLGRAPETCPSRKVPCAKLRTRLAPLTANGWPVRERTERRVQAATGNGGAEVFRILVASNRNLRERAYALAHRVYRKAGYLPEHGNGLLVWPYDAHPETFTLLAQNQAGRDVGTISLVFDSPLGLPCDEIYGPEVKALRARGRRLAEVTRLALDEHLLPSKALLVWLMNLVFVFGVRVRRYNEAVLEVNPRHVNYYRRLLLFEPVGPERSCPRVNGAPAVLLRLDAETYDREIRRFAGLGTAAGQSTLYPYFYPLEDESKAAEFLAQQHHPMSVEERCYFQLQSNQAISPVPQGA